MRSKLTPDQKAKREAKRLRREDRPEPVVARAPTFGAIVERANVPFLATRSIQRHIRSTALRLATIENETKTQASCHTCTTAGCCSMPVTVMLHEAVAIAQALRRDGRDTPELRAALVASAERMETKARHADPQPCVFLDDARRCTVYDVRPRECGEHFVFSDAALCGDPTAPAISKLTLEGDRAERDKTERQFEDVARLARLDGPYVAYLPRAVWLLLEAWDRSDYATMLAEHGATAARRMLAVIRG